jgi:uncharacterized protein (DUF1697 family)
MVAYVALLRGVNVGGRNPIKMTDLRDLFVGLGHADAATFIQSGNVVFTSPDRDAAGLATAIEKRIGRDLGLDVRVILRTKAELGKVIAGNPFDRVDLTKVHVTFLAEKPASERVRALADHTSPPDEFRVIGREVYVHCPSGYGNTKLNNAFWERRLKTAATARNWNSLTKLHALAGAT